MPRDLRDGERDRFLDLLRQVLRDDDARIDRLSIDEMMSLLAREEDVRRMVGKMVADALRD